MPDINQDLLDGISSRFSCRKYKETAIDYNTLKNIFTAASHSPSAKNTQPWETYVVTGLRLEELKRQCLKALTSGKTSSMKHSSPSPALKARATALGRELTPYIEREGWEAKSFIARSISFFDAPTAVIVTMDEPLENIHYIDLGAYIQTLCLAAEAHGIGTCIIGYSLIVKDTIREFLHLSDERHICITASLGYPEASPITEFRSSRSPIEENTHFIG